MNILKSPHQMILEEAGISPIQSPGALKTPQQMLFEESGVSPEFAKGGQNKISPEQMMAMLIANGQEPQKFGVGGKVNAAVNGLFLYPEAKGLYDAAMGGDASKASEHGVGLADTAASMVSIPYTLLSLLLGSGDVAAGTIDETPQQDPIHNKISAPLSKYLLNLGKKK